MYLDLQIELSQNRKTSRSDLITAFSKVIVMKGRRQATDLHVRRLLNYVRAKDHDGMGVERSLKQLAKVLFLTVSTCRRVVRRAVKRFGLLTVIAQRHIPGGQTANRYSINWDQVKALLASARSKRVPSSRSKVIVSTNSTRPSCSDLAPNNSSDAPVFIVQADDSTASATRALSPIGQAGSDSVRSQPTRTLQRLTLGNYPTSTLSEFFGSVRMDQAPPQVLLKHARLARPPRFAPDVLCDHPPIQFATCVRSQIPRPTRTRHINRMSSWISRPIDILRRWPLRFTPDVLCDHPKYALAPRTPCARIRMLSAIIRLSKSQLEYPFKFARLARTLRGSNRILSTTNRLSSQIRRPSLSHHTEAMHRTG